MTAGNRKNPPRTNPGPLGPVPSDGGALAAALVALMCVALLACLIALAAMALI